MKTSKRGLGRSIFNLETINRWLLLAACILWGCVPEYLWAQSFPITTIAGRNIQVPGQAVGEGFYGVGGAPSAEAGPPAIDGENVAFIGWGRDGIPGVYLYKIGDGSLVRVADNKSDIPGMDDKLPRHFYSVCVDGGQVVFTVGNGLPQKGVYAGNGGGITRIADSEMTMPGQLQGQSEKFFDFSPVSSDGGTVVFAATSLQSDEFPSGFQGVYSCAIGGGGWTVLADQNTLIPGRTNEKFKKLFHGWGGQGPIIRNGAVVFMGTDQSDKVGLYKYEGSTLSVIVDGSTLLPSRSEPGYSALVSFGFDGNKTVFCVMVGGSAIDTCTYSHSSLQNPPLQVLFPNSTPIPGHSAYGLNRYDGIAVDNGTVVIAGGGTPALGLYTTYNGPLTRIVDTSQMLDCRSVLAPGVGQHGVSGDRIVFGGWVMSGAYPDESDGIFLVRTPKSEGNSPPVVGNVAYTRSVGMDLRIRIIDLLGKVTDGDTLLLDSLGPAANGVVSKDCSFIYYRPNSYTSLEPDSFTFTVSDGHFGSATGEISVTVKTPPGGVAQEVTVQDQEITIQFVGIPGYQYDVQRSIDSKTWATITDDPLTASGTGLFSFTEVPPSNPTFYRLKQH